MQEGKSEWRASGPQRVVSFSHVQENLAGLPPVAIILLSTRARQLHNSATSGPDPTRLVTLQIALAHFSLYHTG